jgi:predicted amidohydrolase/ribosomal protein S18 acetylase RimI-like enzyme
MTIQDFQGMHEIMLSIYGKSGDEWEFNQIKNLMELFPEGQICIEDKGKVVAFALSIIVNSNKLDDQHTYQQVTGNFTFSTHNPQGDILYGIEIGVHPEYQGMKLGRRLYDARKEICEQLNLKAIVAGGRMPNYHKHMDKLSPKQYIEKVSYKEIYDPVLTFQLSNGFHVRKILTDYLPNDSESRAYATLIEWNNMYYEKKEKFLRAKKTVIRIGVVQWQMRNTYSLESFFDNAEFFVDSMSRYKADYLLFPELFNVPLMSRFNEDDTAKAIRKLAEYTEEIRQKFVEFSLQYNVNIIAGSMPLYENETLYNVAYLCRRDGTYDAQYKIHITPSEANDWGMKGGDELRVFETDVAKIGILICYDAEFPELSRKLADEGMQILFVPFSTDTQNGYQRVRICSQARAIENECYVAIAGSVGNLPKVWSMDLQYAQSAVFSPSDFAFPQNAIIAEGTPNTEMTIIADVDLDLLKELHELGSVKNLKDRRTDLFEMNWKGK